MSSLDGFTLHQAPFLSLFWHSCEGKVQDFSESKIVYRCIVFNSLFSYSCTSFESKFHQKYDVNGKWKFAKMSVWPRRGAHFQDHGRQTRSTTAEENAPKKIHFLIEHTLLNA